MTLHQQHLFVEMPKVLIAGAGLVGSLNAIFFAKKGWDVEVYELRPDIRLMVTFNDLKM